MRNQRMPWRRACCTCAALVGALSFPAPALAAIYVVGPDNYRDVLDRLQPGDTLALESGVYRDGLPIHDLAGLPDARIHIAGPEYGEPAVFHGRRGHNVISIVDSSWITIRNVEIDGRGLPVDAVKLEGHARFGHHITLSDLRIRNLARRQQIVGISTKAPAHGWIVRETRIHGAGTGMYFGDSDGSAPFVGGLIEHNLVTDSIGYAMQIKHQAPRPDIEGLPDGPSTTVIRHNVFAKGDDSAAGNMARPNVLLGHFPEEGPGMHDRYAVHGNLFYNNPAERLFQGEGDIALYNNVFVNPAGSGIAIMPHEGQPRRIVLFHNTILAAEGSGVWFETSTGTERAEVVGNAVFAERPLSGDGASGAGNVVGAYEEADRHLREPFAALGELDLTPLEGALQRQVELPVDLLWDLPGAQQDFDGEPRTGNRLGAYDGGDEPRWVPALEIKPVPDRTARRPAAGGGALTNPRRQWCRIPLRGPAIVGLVPLRRDPCPVQVVEFSALEIFGTEVASEFTQISPDCAFRVRRAPNQRSCKGFSDHVT